MKTVASLRLNAGFTLVELVISAAIASIILGAAYLCLQAGLASRKMVETRSDAMQGARVAMALMSADLRAATPLSREFEFLGMRRMLGEADADNLDFATHNYTPRAPHEGDICEVSYFLDQDPETGSLTLWRRRDPTPDPEPLRGGRREEIVRGVKGLRFEYYDGFEWFTEWGDATGEAAARDATLLPSNLQGMPEAVLIQLAVEPAGASRKKPHAEGNGDQKDEGEPPIVLQTLVRLNLAGAANASVGGDAASTQSGVTTPQTSN